MAPVIVLVAALLAGCATSQVGRWDIEWLPVTNVREVCAGQDACVLRTAGVCRIVTDARSVAYDALGALLLRCRPGG